MQAETSRTGPDRGTLGASQLPRPAANRRKEPILFSGVSQRQLIVTIPRAMIIRFIEQNLLVARTRLSMRWNGDKETKRADLYAVIAQTT